MRPRILIPGTSSGDGEPADSVRLDAARSHHLIRVLRLKPGAPLECFDGRGTRFEAWLETADPRASVIRLGSPTQADTGSSLQITLAQCVCASERMDWLVEKATELGVRELQPLIPAHSPVRLDDPRSKRRQEHWQRIVEAACMQCGRDALPVVHEIRPLGHWLADGARPRARTALVLAPGGDARLRDIRIDFRDPIEILVGPEKGLTSGELANALAAGFRGVRLGTRILRTETAGIAAIAALQALGGDF